ncbi:MAG: ankyrin repeat domain-containing protein [Chloroflexota bacterium]
MRDIHLAMEEHDVARVAAIVSHDPSQIHAPWSADLPDQPLHMAAYADQPEIVAILLDYGADVNARGVQERTPLHVAAYHGSFQVVQILIERGADIGRIDEKGCTPLLLAASNTREPETREVAQVLIGRGATVDLNTAVRLGDIARVQAVLATAPDAIQHAPFPADLVYDAVLTVWLHMIDVCGWSDNEQQAAQAGESQLPLLELLLAHGANVNSIGSSREPALFLAVQLPHPIIATWLLNHGAQIDQKAPNGTLLRTAVASSKAAAAMEATLRAYQPTRYQNDAW